MVGFTVVAVTWGFRQLEKVMGLGRILESDGTFTVGLTVVRLGGSGGMEWMMARWGFCAIWVVVLGVRCFKHLLIAS